MLQGSGARRANRAPTLPGDLSGSFGFLLSKAAQAMRERFEDRLGKRRLIAQQVGILSLVNLRRPATQREIGLALKIDRTTMVHLIDRLEEMRLLQRRDDNPDRRSYAVTITRRGETALRGAMADAREIEREMLHGISKNEIQTLRRLLYRLAHFG